MASPSQTEAPGWQPAPAPGADDRPDTRRLGLVAHPTRSIETPLRELTRWADARGVDVVQIPVYGQAREVAPRGEAGDCDAIVSIGGDGTMLAALHAGMSAARPVLGVACGSLGVLTRVSPGRVADALERLRRGEWSAVRLPALRVTRSDGPDLLAVNDVAIVRTGIGQIRIAIHVDGTLFNRLAGDGCIVSTPLGSSAYAIAAGGPLLSSDVEGYALTPLPTHGGRCPPLVLGSGAELCLDVRGGYGGARLELDGQVAPPPLARVTIRFAAAAATAVAFPGQKPLLAVLRGRQIVVDSPRIVAEDGRRSAG